MALSKHLISVGILALSVGQVFVAGKFFENPLVVKLCGCPETSACPNACQNYDLYRCQVFYQCLQSGNGIFGYVYPEDLGDNIIEVGVYDDPDCSGSPRFESSEKGWQGACDNDCWGGESKVGARGCSDAARDGWTLMTLVLLVLATALSSSSM